MSVWEQCFQMELSFIQLFWRARQIQADCLEDREVGCPG